MSDESSVTEQAVARVDTHVLRLMAEVLRRAPLDAVTLLSREPDPVIAEVLSRLKPNLALEVLASLPEERRDAVMTSVRSELGDQWAVNQSYPEDSVGRLMEPPIGLFDPNDTVADVVERLRTMVQEGPITYGYVIDADGRLEGVLVMRDLLLAASLDRIADLMLTEPFSFSPDASVSDAMRAVVRRHYPVYPVCDAQGVLIGLVHGHALFEQQAFEISAQVGRMVGVEKEERLLTPWLTSLKFRHPWLQLNLLTAFLAAFVVGLFEGTIERLVALAVFLPVLAGQSGNTGCQSMAVTIRAITLGELKAGAERKALLKEALLGLANGALVGLSAGAGMYVYANLSGSPAPLGLGVVVFLAMVGSCVASGVSGVLVPVTLKRLGADPATASSIFLTTATDVVSMGMLLGLATLLIR